MEDIKVNSNEWQETKNALEEELFQAGRSMRNIQEQAQKLGLSGLSDFARETGLDLQAKDYVTVAELKEREKSAMKKRFKSILKRQSKKEPPDISL